MSLVFEEKRPEKIAIEMLSDRQMIERLALIRAAKVMADNQLEETEAELLGERQKVDELMIQLRIKDAEIALRQPPWWRLLWRWIWRPES